MADGDTAGGGGLEAGDAAGGVTLAGGEHVSMPLPSRTYASLRLSPSCIVSYPDLRVQCGGDAFWLSTYATQPAVAAHRASHSHTAAYAYLAIV